MSVRVMGMVWQHSKQRGVKLLLLLAIADFSDDDGVAWPSIETLMQKCRSCKRAVQAALYGLRDSGELAVHPKPGGGYIFTIIPPCAGTCAPAQKPAPANGAETCATPAQKPAPHMLLKDVVSVEPSVEPSNRSHLFADKGVGGRCLSADAQRNFDAFWKVYPRKVGKQAAENAWKRVKNLPPLGELLASLAAQKASYDWTKEGGQFIPHPTTWLNQGRWADEIRPAPPPDPKRRRSTGDGLPLYKGGVLQE